MKFWKRGVNWKSYFFIPRSMSHQMTFRTVNGVMNHQRRPRMILPTGGSEKKRIQVLKRVDRLSETAGTVARR